MKRSEFAGMGGSLVDMLDDDDDIDLGAAPPDCEWGEIARELALLRIGGEFVLFPECPCSHLHGRLHFERRGTEQERNTAQVPSGHRLAALPSPRSLG